MICDIKTSVYVWAIAYMERNPTLLMSGRNSAEGRMEGWRKCGSVLQDTSSHLLC